MRSLLVVTSILMTPPAAVQAQHDHAHSPYADLVVDSAATVPAEEAAQLRAGEGMGFALVAELNQYPGPKHAVELAVQLALSDEQVASLGGIRERMTREAVAKGLEVLAAEGLLTTLFRDGTATAGEIARQTATIGRLRGELRAIHLEAHLETKRLLTPEQVRDYDRHRGYR